MDESSNTTNHDSDDDGIEGLDSEAFWRDLLLQKDQRIAALREQSNAKIAQICARFQAHMA